MRRAVVVDDERLARRELRSLLEPHPGIRVVGEAGEVRDAAEQVRAAAADVVFLDIQLGGESGFDLLPLLPEGVSVVFVTAFDEYAVRAFEVNGLDYLLKPVAPGRLARTLERLARAADAEPDPPAAGGPLAYDDRLFLPLGRGMGFLQVSTIRSITSDGDYTDLRLASGETVSVRKPLAEWAERLPPQHFARIHRSAVVNLDAVERVEPWFNGGFLVYLRGDEEPLSMSRRHASRLRSRMG